MRKAERELHYQITMCIVSNMVIMGIISDEDYLIFEQRMNEKNKPIFSGIFFGKPPQR